MPWGVKAIHELAVTEGILSVVLEHAERNGAQRVLSISIVVGELRDIVEDWVQRYFDYLSRGTAAEGANIRIERSPAMCRCEDCGNLFNVNIWDSGRVLCPGCGGGKAVLESGREFYVKEIEVT